MLQHKIIEINDQAEALKNAIAGQLKQLPDNPKIQRLSKNAFVISSKHLGNNWTPEYHDWRRQYEYLAATVQKMDFRNLVSFLAGIVKTGSHRDSATNQRWTFAPEVRQYLATLLAH